MSESLAAMIAAMKGCVLQQRRLRGILDTKEGDSNEAGHQRSQEETASQSSGSAGTTAAPSLLASLTERIRSMTSGSRAPSSSSSHSKR
jgi:hypothetical protein